MRIAAIATLNFLFGARMWAAEAAHAHTLQLKIDLPLDYQVVQRHTRNDGKLTVAGAVQPGGPAPDALAVRITERSTASFCCSDIFAPLQSKTEKAIICDLFSHAAGPGQTSATAMFRPATAAKLKNSPGSRIC